MHNSVARGAHFYAYDGMGNMAALADSGEGKISANCEFDPFGKRIRTTGTDCPYQFSTKRSGEIGDFVLYEHRIYGPSFGRWLSRDSAGESKGLNLFGMVGNDCLSKCDKMGLSECDISVTYVGDCDTVLSASDQSAIQAALCKAATRLDEVANGNRPLPSNLTQQVANCLRNKLRSLGIGCPGKCNPLCWGHRGFTTVLTGDTVFICAESIKKNEGNLATDSIVRTVFHEMAHTCGVDSESTCDSWAAWLMVSLPPSRPRQ